MRFIVATTDGPRSYIGTPTFLEGGVLRIDQDSSERGPTHSKIWLSPTFWQEITEDVSYHPLKGDFYHFGADQ